ncbi:ThiF family adenylyltransferase [Streptomyces sp. NPDC091280]|uniref:ThiF family adenylyltransferase n=1 Tax=Streptomyces sp. NPDC091280 TaxID=3365984 RepID=UPI00380A1B19
MSDSRLVRSSADLARLVEDGYAVRVVNSFLVIDDIPFVDDAAQVQWGSFLCPLDLSGDTAVAPSSHVMCFVGGVPRDKDGNPIDGLVNESVEKWSASPELTASCGFSQKPEGGYPDYYEKVTHYVAMVIGPAQAVAPEVTPLTFKPVETDEGDGVFRYLDTFSSRAGITEMNARLALKKVVIVGLGGTGAYLLDLLAKTPVQALHLYDKDVFRTHNAFRSPSAASLADLKEGLKKVDYYKRMYSRMRRHIAAHPVNVTSENVGEILDADFVFLAMDTSLDKKVIIETLTVNGIAFIDTGVGVGKNADRVDGQIRVTTSLPGRSEHIERDGIISYFAGEDAEYDTNLQVAELNSFAATLAVYRYKKYLGFYADAENELHTVYAVGSNGLYNRYNNSMNQDQGIGSEAEPVSGSADAGDGAEAAA